MSVFGRSKSLPFQIKDDKEMFLLQESIEKYGILNSLIVRPVLDGYYEIISGHRRKYAAEKLGYWKVPVIIRVLSEDDSILSIDEDRRRNATLLEDSFYNRKNLNPQIHDTEKRTMMEVPEGVDAELLAKVLSNPEMAVLLTSLAKSMQGEHN